MIPLIALKDQTVTDNKGQLRKYCEDEFDRILISLPNYDTDMKNIFNFCNKLFKGGADLQEILWTSN